MQPDPRSAQRDETPLTTVGGYLSDKGMAFILVAVLHVICCGLPLLLLSGVSLAFLAPYWPIAAWILAALGAVGFVWYFKRGCATCPRNEGRCSVHPRV